MGVKERGKTKIQRVQQPPQETHCMSEARGRYTLPLLSYLQLQEDLEITSSSKNKRWNKTLSKHSSLPKLFLTFITTHARQSGGFTIPDIVFWATHCHHLWMSGYRHPVWVSWKVYLTSHGCTGEWRGQLTGETPVLPTPQSPPTPV